MKNNKLSDMVIFFLLKVKDFDQWLYKNRGNNKNKNLVIMD